LIGSIKRPDGVILSPGRLQLGKKLNNPNPNPNPKKSTFDVLKNY